MSEINYESAAGELSFGGEEQATQAAPEPQTKEEALEFLLGEQKFNVPLSYNIPIKHNGEMREVPLGSVINSWRQNSQLQTKQAEFKQKLQEYENKFNSLGPDYERVLEFQKWSEQNPDQWNKLWTALNEKEKYTLASGGENPDNGLTPDHPLLGHVTSLTQKLEQLEQKLGRYEQLEQESEKEQIVSQVNAEIEKFTNEFPDLDLATPDEDGLSLRGQILKFGAENGYPTFRSAAIDFQYPDGSSLLDKLKSSALNQGRTDAVKTIKQDKKNGILERSNVPSFGQDNKVNPSRLSDDDRMEAALKELTASFQGF